MVTGFMSPKIGSVFFFELVCILEYFGGGEVEVGAGEGVGVILQQIRHDHETEHLIICIRSLIYLV